MPTDPQSVFAEQVEELLSRDAPPYQPRPGDRSLLSFSIFQPVETREERLSQPTRLRTLMWLTAALSAASRRPLDEAFSQLLRAIPEGEEDTLDGGAEFIFAVDEAAIMLGCDPSSVKLRPARLDS